MTGGPLHITSRTMPLFSYHRLVAAALLVALAALGAQAQPAITSFTLVDADADADLGPLRSGDIIDLSALSTQNLNVRANATSSTGSVVFELDGSEHRTENDAPYALAGDNRGNYHAWSPTPGAHTLTATPYSQDDGHGAVGAALAITLTVVEEGDGGGGGGEGGGGGVTLAGVTDDGGVTSALYRYRPVTLTLEGPFASEGGTLNPFLDYRFDVTFTAPSGERLVVPGYFAADGNAANSGASAGTAWRAHLTPSGVGTWTYEVSFRRGAAVAVSESPTAGSALAPYDGRTGSFTVQEAPQDSPGNYARGPLRYVGQRYLRFDNGEAFLKGGADSPENLLAYEDFDNTYNTGGPDYVKSWGAHVGDWRPGDPTWRGGKGKGLIGALNYLGSEGMNAFSFLTMNAPQGDGKDVWPWTSPSARTRYDVSKLAQWDVVFGHADRLGLFLHFKTQEQENDQVLDGGALGPERRLYYRELVARFGYHLALNWNLGEENTNTDAQRRAFAAYFNDLDPYDHPIVVHTYPGDHDDVYGALLGNSDLTGASVQLQGMQGGHAATREWLRRSAEAGRPWHVSIDEPGTGGIGATCDGPSNNHTEARREALWANLMAGGTGVEWYFGYQTCAGDLDAEDWRTRDRLWDYTRYALALFRNRLPFTEMVPANDLTGRADDYVFAREGEAYAIYLPQGGNVSLSLPAGDYGVRWFSPREGGALQTGSVASVEGGGSRGLGQPPEEPGQDWVALVTRSGGGDPPGEDDPPAPEDDVVFAVNAGGDAFAAADGTVYAADRAYSGGRTSATSDPIAGTTDDALYQTERLGTFSYRVPVEDGVYQVVLRLAEVFWQENGRRVFDVRIEGQRAIEALDLHAEAGHDAAYDVAWTAFVTDGTLDLDFITVADNAKVGAVLVRRVPMPGTAGRGTGDESAAAALEFRLDGAYPNPFHPSTTVRYELAESADVRLEVYDLQGRRIAVLVDATQGAGRQEVHLDGSDLASGSYVLRLEARGEHQSFTAAKQVVLVR